MINMNLVFILQLKIEKANFIFSVISARTELEQHFLLKIQKFTLDTANPRRQRAQLFSKNCAITDVRTLGCTITNFPIYQCLGSGNIEDFYEISDEFLLTHNKKKITFNFVRFEKSDVIDRDGNKINGIPYNINGTLQVFLRILN